MRASEMMSIGCDGDKSLRNLRDAINRRDSQPPMSRSRSRARPNPTPSVRLACLCAPRTALQPRENIRLTRYRAKNSRATTRRSRMKPNGSNGSSGNAQHNARHTSPRAQTSRTVAHAPTIPPTTTVKPHTSSVRTMHGARAASVNAASTSQPTTSAHPSLGRRINAAHRGARPPSRVGASTNDGGDARTVSRRQLAAIAIATTAASRAHRDEDDAAKAVESANDAVTSPPRGYDAPETSPTGWNAFVSSSESLARAPYAIDWPSGWCSLTDVKSARGVGVDASWKDPLDEASTLAIFITSGVAARDIRGKYGSIDADARVRAESAPNQMTIGARTSSIDAPPNRSTRRRRRLETHEIETKVGGGTAGRFGSAIELVRIFIVPGEGDGENWEVLIRATASASAWPRVKTRLRAVAASFRFLDMRDE